MNHQSIVKPINYKNRNYKSLYYKYKKKYLEKKSKMQKGGSMPQKNRINFTIYTTGISNWLNATYDQNNNQNIARIYNNLKGNIINQIPIRYDISIKHYDPLIQRNNIDTSNNNKNTFERICENLEFIRNITNNEVMDNIIVSKSEFFAQGLKLSDISMNEPYLILDFAHLFTYTANPNVVEYGRNYFYPIEAVEVDLNVIRTGFLGNPIASALFGSNNLFVVNDDNTILTLTKKMRQDLIFLQDPRYWQLPNEPSDIFVELIRQGIYSLGDLPRIKSIKILIEDKIRELFGISLDAASAKVENKFNDNNFMISITNKLIRKVWDGHMPVNLDIDGRQQLQIILEEISGQIIEENIEYFSV